MTISYKSIINKVNLEAIRFAPDGNLYTGYHVLSGRKIQFLVNKEVEISIVPNLADDLRIDLEVISGGVTQMISDIKNDITL